MQVFSPKDIGTSSDSGNKPKFRITRTWSCIDILIRSTVSSVQAFSSHPSVDTVWTNWTLWTMRRADAATSMVILHLQESQQVLIDADFAMSVIVQKATQNTRWTLPIRPAFPGRKATDKPVLPCVPEGLPLTT